MPAAKKPVPATSSTRTVPARRSQATRTPPAPPVIPAGAAAPAAGKPRKIKVIRDSFRIPEPEYAVLQALKQRAAHGGRAAKKSEVLRAGVQALVAMGDGAFVAALAAIPATKATRAAKT